MLSDIFLLKHMPHAWIVFLVTIIVLDVITILHILKNKHDQPVSALLWIFLIIEFHLLGILAYLVLGINRLHTTGLKIERSHKSMNEVRKSPGSLLKYLEEVRKFHYSGTPQNYLSVLDKILPGTYPICGNKLELLEDGTAAYPVMFSTIQNAKNHIHLQSYIIMNDEAGKKLFSLLEKKAHEGVKIKVIFDKMGSMKAYKSRFFKSWAKKIANFEVKPFSKVNLFAPYRIQLRNHRKLLIVDGEVAFVGGINISSDNYRSTGKIKRKIDQSLQASFLRWKPKEKLTDKTGAVLKNKFIHDLHCKIEGPAVGEFQYCFLRDWCFASKMNPSKLLETCDYFSTPRKCGNSIVRVNPSGPGQAYEASEKLFMTAVTTAQKSIWIVTPYFVPDKSFIKMLCMAAARKIEIKIIIPQNNNHWYVRYATRSLYNTLLRSNVKIYEKKGAFSHVKAMIVDGTWASMGSSNCDNRSFRLNYELDFAVEGGEFIQDLYGQFLREIEESKEITFAMRQNRKFPEELLENFCSLLTPVL